MTDSGFLVLGGTGHYGKYIVNSLLKRNVPFRVLTRDPEKASRSEPGAKYIYGNISNPESVKNALKGMRGLIISLSALSPGQVRKLQYIEQECVIRTLEYARIAGVERLIYVSIFKADREFAQKMKLAIASEKAAVEEYIRSSGFNWNILGCPPSMEIFFAMIRGNRMMVPGGGPPALPTLSPYDLGEIVAKLALKSEIGHRRIQLTGPDIISFREAAERISTVWKREIKYVKIPLFIPLMARTLIGTFRGISDKALFLYILMGYLKLLNRFPVPDKEDLAEKNREFYSILGINPTTIEMEAARRLD